MTLQDYLARESLSYTAFAALIGAKFPSTAERYAKGLQIPGRSMMGRIVRATKGEVLPNDFYGFHAEADTAPANGSSSGKCGDVTAKAVGA